MLLPSRKALYKTEKPLLNGDKTDVKVKEWEKQHVSSAIKAKKCNTEKRWLN